MNKKQQSFFSGLVLAVLVNFTVKPAWILVDNWVQDKIGHEEYGIYGAILSFILLFSPLVDWGINQYFVKKIANSRTKQPRLFAWGLTLKMFLAFVYTSVLLIVGSFIGYTFSYPAILLGLAGYNIFIFLIAFLRSYVKAFQNFYLDAFFSLMDKLVFLPLLLFLTPTTAKEYAAIALSSAVLSFIIYFSIFFSFYKPKIVFKGKSSLRLLKGSSVFAFMQILGLFFLHIGKVHLEQSNGAAETSLFIGGARWIFAAEMYIWTILQLFYARFAHLHKDLSQSNALLRKGMIIVGFPMLWTFAFMFSWGEKLMFLFKNSTPEQINTMVTVMKIIATSLLLNGFFNIFSTYLTSNGYEKKVNKLLAISLIFHILLNFILIPLFGAIGLAISFISAMLINVSGYVLLVEKKTQVSIPYGQIGKIFLIILLQISFAWTLKKHTTIEWYFQAGLQILSLLFFGYIFRVLNKETCKI